MHKRHMAPDGAAQILREAKLRQTPVRMHVLTLLSRATEPHKASQIIATIPSDIDPVTVYRTLNTLVRKSIIHRIKGADRVWRYAIGGGAPGSAGRHPHFICETCGRIECLNDILLPENLLRLLRVDAKFAVTFPEVLLHGTCPRCCLRP